MRRRWIARISAGMVIGALINLGIAWLTIVTLPSAMNGPGVARQTPTDGRGYVGSVPASLGEPSRAFHFNNSYSDYWQVQWDGPDPDEYFKDEAVVHVYRHGIPFRSLEARSIYVGPQSHLVYGGPAIVGVIPLPSWAFRLWIDRTMNTQYYGHLPFLPIWPGLFVNSLLYGALSLGAWLGMLRWRRRRRVRRGLCPRCAYDLAGMAVCSECGWGEDGSVAA